MKLAFCLFNYFPYGGLQRDFYRIAEEAYHRGHEIHVFTMHWQGDKPAHFNIHLIKAKGWQNHTRIKNYIANVAPHLSGFDLCIGFNKMPFLDIYYAADICFLSRIRQKRRILSFLLPRDRYYAELEKVVFQKGSKTKILLISEAQKALFKHYYHTEEARFLSLPPGITKDRIRPSNAETIRNAVRQKHHISEGTVLLLMVGSGFKTKGVDRAIKAIGALKPAIRKKIVLFIIGADDASAYLKLARKLKLDDIVFFLGARKDVPNYLLAADMLLHTAYHENTGTAILEALVAGLPILTYDHCGYAKYVDFAKCGIVLPSESDITHLKDHLERVVSASELRDGWQQNAIHYAKHHDLYSLVLRACDYIDELDDKKTLDLQDVHYINKELKPFLKENTSVFKQCMALQGEIYREQKGRITALVKIGNQSYFIKKHFGPGKRELVKNLFQFRLPVTSACNEYVALNKLQSIGVRVPKPIAYGKNTSWLGKQTSFILMENVPYKMTVEERLQEPKLSFQDKIQLIQKVAIIARQLHSHNLYHRDFYLCHFLLQEDGEICLIDLHRAGFNKYKRLRWIFKDLAALYFSSKNIKLNRSDYIRFMKHYDQMNFREIWQQKKSFWIKVKKRGDAYRDHTLQ